MSKLMLVGGPHGGKSMECVGPILKMPKQVPLALAMYPDDESSEQIATYCPVDRYVLKTVTSDGQTYQLYVYEYDIHQDAIGLLIREIHKLNRRMK